MMRSATNLLVNSDPPLEGFDAVAETYDQVFSDSPIGRAQRRFVWEEMDRVFHAGQRILEINCGTGVDALHLAERGIEVFAYDSAPRMIALAQQRLNASSTQTPVHFERLRTEELDRVEAANPFDGVLSNFSGLNCVSDLPVVVRSLTRLIKPRGRAILCVFGAFCLWETLWHLSGRNVHKAFRRFHQRGVSAALSADARIQVHYRSVGALRKAFAPHFRLERWRGVGVISPPSCADSVPVRFPRLFERAVEIDSLLGRWPGFRCLADHAVLTLRRVEEDTA